MSVKRWVAEGWGGMDEAADSVPEEQTYRSAADYAALEERIRAVIAERDGITRGAMAEIDGLKKWVDELKARLASKEEQHAYCHEFLQLAKQGCDELRAALREAMGLGPQERLRFALSEKSIDLLLRLGDLEKTADGLKWRVT